MACTCATFSWVAWLLVVLAVGTAGENSGKATSSSQAIHSASGASSAQAEPSQATSSVSGASPAQAEPSKATSNASGASSAQAEPSQTTGSASSASPAEAEQSNATSSVSGVSPAQAEPSKASSSASGVSPAQAEPSKGSHPRLTSSAPGASPAKAEPSQATGSASSASPAEAEQSKATSSASEVSPAQAEPSKATGSASGSSPAQAEASEGTSSASSASPAEAEQSKATSSASGASPAQAEPSEASSSASGSPPAQADPIKAASSTLAPAVAKAQPSKGPGANASELDINPTGACSASLPRLCGHVERGAGRQAHCLRSQMQAALERREYPLTAECVDELHRFFVNGTRTGKLNDPVPGFNKACKADRSIFCNGMKGPALIACLKVKKRVKGALTDRCNEKVFELQQQEARYVHLDAQLMEMCQGDLKRLNCEWSKGPGSRKACLNAKFRNLTVGCQGALFTRMQDDLSDVRLNQRLYTACRSEISSACGSVAFGEARILKCLWEKQDGEHFGLGCRKRVKQLTRLQVSDFRLDYRIRVRCARDIPRLCAREQVHVDTLPVTELFGDGWQEGKSGEVLQCLKVHFRNIAERGCKQEIKRLVAVHAEDPESDRIFSRKCKADIAAFCNTSSPERVHTCLRKHLPGLSRPCKEAELLQGSLAAMEITMKPLMAKACEGDIQSLCAGVQKGDAQVIQCLQDHINADGMTKACNREVKNDLLASNHDWRLKFGIHESCRGEADRLCSGTYQNQPGNVLACLRRSDSKVADPVCSRAISLLVKQSAEDIRSDPATYNVCMGDVNRFCADVPPGQGRVHECLVNHSTLLSHACAEAELDNQARLAEDIRAHPRGSMLCKSSWNALCPDVPPGDGRRWECLERNREDPRMAEGCRAVVLAQQRLSNFHFQLDHGLSRRCSKEAARLCPLEVSLMRAKPFSSEGVVISCLLQKREKVESPSCQTRLASKAAQRLGNIENDPTASRTCREDVRAFCSDVASEGRGELHKCLQRHLKDISMKCREIEIEYMQMATQDIRLMSWMRGECGSARKRYCAHLEEGDSGEAYVTTCMLRSMHRPGMEPECRAKLVELERLRALDLRFNPLMSKHCQADLLRLQETHATEAVCAPQGEEVVALSGLGIRCLISHRGEVRAPDCQSSISSVLRQHSNDLRAKPGMEKACRGDIEALCPEIEPGSGRLHACLRKNKQSIANKDCLSMVMEALQAEKEDASISPRIRKHCSLQIKLFCGSVEHGEARVLNCLRLHQYQFSSAGDACKRELEALGFNGTTLYNATGLSTKGLLAGAGSELSTREAQSVLKALLRHPSWIKWGPAVLGIACVVIVAGVAGIVALAVQLRKGRPDFGIEVEQAEKEDVP
uniref:Golgi apparatus protein 1 n=1 Tax=Alexandrium monilatum TaxID=311494 RepID=A0A7S4WEG8_9DINO